MKDKRNKLYHWYAIASLLIILIPFIICFTRTGSQNEIIKSNYTDISSDFLTSTVNGEAVDYTNLGKLMDEDIGVLNIYYRLPDDFVTSDFVYRSKDVSSKVFIDDELLYETKVYDSPIYNASPGNLWNSVKIDSKYKGQWIRLEITMIYDSNAITIDHVFIGDKSDIINSYIEQKLSGIIISLLIITVGVFLFVMNIIEIFRQSLSRSGNISLALYSIGIGLWSLCETNTLQFFVSDMRMIQLLDNMMMFVATLPMLFFLDSHYKILDLKAIRVFCYGDILLLVFCFIMQITDISDFHSYIFLAWTTFFLFTSIILVSTTINLYHKFKHHTIQPTNLMHIIGFVLLTITGAYEAIKYSIKDSSDRAEFFRLGILLFVVFFAIGNQIQNYKMVAQGTKYNIIKDLAYNDGLTKLQNRTSYLEKIDALSVKHPKPVGIIFLDINNLKTINDNLGHEQGDNLIKYAAKCIKNSFGVFGNVYRIGGDEFCVFIENDDINKAYDSAVDLFDKCVDECNTTKLKNFKLEIAYGFSIFDPDDTCSLEDKIKDADEKMYAHKAILKELVS